MREKVRKVVCSCYVANCKHAKDRERRSITSVAECPVHSTRALRELLERGKDVKRSGD